MNKLLGLMLSVVLVGVSVTNAADQPHAVFVVGTPHYSPQLTMPPLAKQLESFGFKTTVVMAGHNPERSARGIEGLDVLKQADVAVFYARFLTLPDSQLQYIVDYVESGRPVVGFRTSTHAFVYPANDKKSKWNDGFGRQVLGSKYFIHGKGGTTVDIVDRANPIVTGIKADSPLNAAGTLYLSDLPKDARVLMRGTGEFARTGKVTNGFGTHDLKSTMTDDIAWTWTNQWGGRVFATTLGHPQTFADENFVRLFVNGIHWAVGKPVPGASTKVHPIAAKPEPKKPRGKRRPKNKSKKSSGPVDGRNRKTGKPEPPKDPDLAKYAIYARTAPKPQRAEAVETTLPLALNKGDRIVYIGNTLLDYAGRHGFFEALVQQSYADKEVTFRNLSWSADEVDLQPRPDNFASMDQHLTVQQADVIFAAFGFNESFAGVNAALEYKVRLTGLVNRLKTSAFNGKTGPRIILLSPIAAENIKGVDAADMHNDRLAAYVKITQEVAAEQRVGFANVFDDTKQAMADASTDLTDNGVHLNEAGYRVFAESLFRATFQPQANQTLPTLNDKMLDVIQDKNEHFFYRYRPLNTFYYTGGRSGRYGYLDFLPAMRNFDIMVANRDKKIWQLARNESVSSDVDDSNVPELPEVPESRGANRWMTPKEELAHFKVDPRFEVNLFASEEEFPDIACPIQMRWDSKGRMWVSCSTTYPHVYPGQTPIDKIVILEDTDNDGKADKSTVFADDLYVPLSFEFGDGGLYVSEEPHLTFIKDTDGDGKADYRRPVFTGFGCEDSHHALHDFVWTPDGDLLFRESIFHNSQVETAYGPVRAKNSAWFRYRPTTHKLVSFGAYPNTNPWGVTFDDWGHHVASHPVFASTFHATNPPYPTQHPKAGGMQAYSGTCGQEFVDFPNWPKELQDCFIKVRYKPTNRVEIHKWVEQDDHFKEEYQGDLIFSTNLSFIPVDLRYGPRGAMYVCDWYNPIKGHAQYSLRDTRRDRVSGRIWRIVPKGAKLQDPPAIEDQPVQALLDNLKRREYRYRYWTKREIRSQDADTVKAALDKWVAALDKNDPRYRHHQIEAVWTYRNINRVNVPLLRELLNCDNHHARAAATRQLRYWHTHLSDGMEQLKVRMNDANGLVRQEAVIAASYIGTKEAASIATDVLKHPMGNHLKYATTTAFGSAALSRHWQNEAFLAANPQLVEFNKAWAKHAKLASSIQTRDAGQAGFDSQKNLKTVNISCVPERMLYTVTKFTVKAGQPVKLVFTNPDVTMHNLVIGKPGSLEAIGTAGNEMAKDPEGIKKHFIPKSDQILHHTKLLATNTGEVLRFKAPSKPGNYPYLCTFPGHWVIMKGTMIVK